jgi:hypothetical protein
MGYFLDLSATFEFGDLSVREVLMKRAAKVSASFFIPPDAQWHLS